MEGANIKFQLGFPNSRTALNDRFTHFVLKQPTRLLLRKLYFRAKSIENQGKMRLQHHFFLLLPFLVLLSCSSPKSDPDAVPGFLVAAVDGKPAKATCTCTGLRSSEAPGTIQLHFTFNDAANGAELFSVIVFRFKEQPAKISSGDLMPLAADSVLPSANAITKNDSLSYYVSKMDMEINSYELIDAHKAKISGRLSGRLYYDVELSAGKQPFIEIRDGVFTDIEVTII